MSCIVFVLLAGCDDSTGPADVDAKMSIKYPKGGEVFSFGDTVVVRFDGNSDSVTSIGVSVSSGGKYMDIKTAGTVINKTGLNTYSIDWVVGREEEYESAELFPDMDFEAGDVPVWACKIKIYDTKNKTEYIESDQFTVEFTQPFYLRYPNGGETFDHSENISVIYSFRADKMSNIQYFFWSIEEGDWSQINDTLKRYSFPRTFQMVTSRKVFKPSNAQTFILGDSTKIMVNDYTIDDKKISGWIKITK